MRVQARMHGHTHARARTAAFMRTHWLHAQELDDKLVLASAVSGFVQNSILVAQILLLGPGAKKPAGEKPAGKKN